MSATELHTPSEQNKVAEQASSKPKSSTMDKIKGWGEWALTYIGVGYVANAIFSTWLAFKVDTKYAQQVEKIGEGLGKAYKSIGLYSGDKAIAKGKSNLRGGLLCMGGFAFIPLMKWMEEHHEAIEEKIGDAFKLLGFRHDEKKEAGELIENDNKQSWVKTLISRFAGVALVITIASNVKDNKTFQSFQNGLAKQIGKFGWKAATPQNEYIKKAFAEDLIYTVVTAGTFAAGQGLFKHFRKKNHAPSVAATLPVEESIVTTPNPEEKTVNFSERHTPRMREGGFTQAVTANPHLATAPQL